MEQILGLRPFVPARDFALSKRYYAALGFSPTLEEKEIAIFKMESFSFILQNFYRKEAAENAMVQLMVRNADSWWERLTGIDLAADFGITWAPRAPKMQPWGLKVGFLADPSGVLWHIAEVPF